MDNMGAGDMGHINVNNNYLGDLQDNIDNIFDILEIMAQDEEVSMKVLILVFFYFLATGLALAIYLFYCGLLWIWSYIYLFWIGFGAIGDWIWSHRI